MRIYCVDPPKIIKFFLRKICTKNTQNEKKN